jgi:hypothetical protein
VPVAHACNLSYLGGRDQEDLGITVRYQPGQIVFESYLRKPHHKKGLVEWLKVKALSSNPSTNKKKGGREREREKERERERERSIKEEGLVEWLKW